MNKVNSKAAAPAEEKKPLTKEQAEDLAKKMTEESAGKYIIVQMAKGESKLSLKDLKKAPAPKKGKDGKPVKAKIRTEMDMFCVSWNKPDEGGLALAKINSFRADKKNNVYMVADIVMSLDGLKPVFANAIWEFALSCGAMWAPYGTRLEKSPEHFNTDAAYESLGYENRGDEIALRAQMWADMTAGKFTAEALQKALETPTKYEEYAKELHGTWKQLTEEKNLMYLAARIEREEMSEKAMAVFCQKEHEAYVRLGLSGAGSIAEEAEAVMAYYAVQHEKDKEARKAARIAKKAGKTA